MSLSIADIPADKIAAALSAVLTAAGVTAPLALAPAVLAALWPEVVKLLEADADGSAPLPVIERVELPDDEAQIVALLEQLRAQGAR